MQSLLRQAARPRFSASVLSRQTNLRSNTSTFRRTLVTKGYTSDHETVSYDDATSVGVVTITEYAQQSLGDVVFVELPEEGATIEKGDIIGAVESVKAASDIYAPVSGVIEEINRALADQPGLINKSPEDKGWLCKVKLTKPAEVEELMNEKDYKASISSD
jgi:glycine cleavage system H protein